MLYDDDKTKDWTDKFPAMVQKARNFAENDLPKLRKITQDIMPLMNKLLEKPDRTPEEEQMLDEVHLMLQEYKQAISNSKLILNASMTNQCMAFYSEIEKQARAGNAEAQKLYEQIRPSYLAMLQENMNGQLQ